MGNDFREGSWEWGWVLPAQMASNGPSHLPRPTPSPDTRSPPPPPRAFPALPWRSGWLQIASCPSPSLLDPSAVPALAAPMFFTGLFLSREGQCRGMRGSAEAQSRHGKRRPQGSRSLCLLPHVTTTVTPGVWHDSLGVTDESERLLAQEQELPNLFPPGRGWLGVTGGEGVIPAGVWPEGKGAECENFRTLSCLSTRCSLCYFLPQDDRGSGWAPGGPSAAVSTDQARGSDGGSVCERPVCTRLGV